MIPYSSLSSNYIYNKFSFPNIKNSISELYNDLNLFKYTIPNEIINTNTKLYNLPITKVFQGINRVRISDSFDGIGVLKSNLNKEFKPILNFINNINIQPYYYNQLNWYYSGYSTEFSGIGRLNNSNYQSNNHPIFNIVLLKILPLLMQDSMVDYRKTITEKSKEINHFNLSNIFNEYLRNNKKEFIETLSNFLIVKLITLNSNYSTEISNKLHIIISEYINQLPLLNFKLNVSRVNNNILNLQYNQLILNTLNNETLLNISNEKIYEYNEYLKQFNNIIASNILTTNEETFTNLQIIIGDFKYNYELLINSIYIVYALAIDSLKSNFNDTLLPSNFSKDLYLLVTNNINHENINFFNFKTNQQDIIHHCILKYFISIFQIYFETKEIEELLLGLLKELQVYNIYSTSMYNLLKNYMILYLLNEIINGKLFNEISDAFIKLHTSTNINFSQQIYFQNRLEKIKNSNEESYLDQEIFNFFYDSVLLNIADSQVSNFII